MIRDTTPLPRRPKAEGELLDLMLRVLKFKRPMESTAIVRLVKTEAMFADMPKPCAVDIRMMLRPPYFKLEDQGWVCTWRL